MGGLWPGAASALAKRSALARGWVREPKTGAAPGAAGVSATLWHAWQISQDRQCPSASSAECPAQSGAAGIADSWSKLASALILWV